MTFLDTLEVPITSDRINGPSKSHYVTFVFCAMHDVRNSRAAAENMAERRGQGDLFLSATHCAHLRPLANQTFALKYSSPLH